MPKRYAPETKEKILAVVREAREGGKKWAETLEIAKAAGYNGGLIALQAMVGAAAKKAKKAAAPAAPAAPAAAAEGKRARRNLTTGEIVAQKRGIIPAGWEVGTVDAGGVFTPGLSAKTAKRAKGRKRRVKAVKVAKAAPAVAVPAGGLSEIEAIVQREVVARLKKAKEAACKAFSEALGV